MPSRIEALSALLAQGFSSRIDGAAVVAPSLFDDQYNTAIIACAIYMLGRENKETKAVEVNASILRFCCFIATRPVLLEDFEIWESKTRKIGGLDLESWPQLPRGFLTDRTHSGAVDFLASTGLLQRNGSNVSAPSSGALFDAWVAMREQNFFKAERGVLERLRELRVTQTMLGVAR